MMMKGKYITALLCVAMATATCRAADFDYAEMLLNIDRNNLELKSMSVQNDAEIYSLNSENRLAPTDFDILYLAGSKNVGNKFEFGVAQSFDWLSVYKAKSNSIKARSEALQSEFNWKRMDLHTQAMEICAEIVWINKQIAVHEQCIANVRRVKSAYETAFKHGEVSIIDNNKLKIEEISAERALRDLELQRVAAVQKLSALNGGVNSNYESVTEYPQLEIPASADNYFDELLATRPELNYYKKAQEVAAQNVSVAKREKMPSFAVGYRYVNELGDKFNGVTAGVSIPLFSGSSKVKAAKSQAIVAQLNEDQWKTNARLEFNADYDSAVRLESELNEYEAVDLSNHLSLLNKAQSAQQMSLAEYLIEVRFYEEAVLERLYVEYLFVQSKVKVNRYNF